MLPTAPPNENLNATRKVVLDLARDIFRPILHKEVDELPEWLRSLHTATILRACSLEPHRAAARLAEAIERETAARYPHDAYARLIEREHPHLSARQRTRLAEYAFALHEVAALRCGTVDLKDLIARGFTEAEAHRLNPAALMVCKLKDAERAEKAEQPAAGVARLREAGTRAAVRFSFEEGREPALFAQTTATPPPPAYMVDRTAGALAPEAAR